MHKLHPTYFFQILQFSWERIILVSPCICTCEQSDEKHHQDSNLISITRKVLPHPQTVHQLAHRTAFNTQVRRIFYLVDILALQNSRSELQHIYSWNFHLLKAHADIARCQCELDVIMKTVVLLFCSNLALGSLEILPNSSHRLSGIVTPKNSFYISSPPASGLQKLVENPVHTTTTAFIQCNVLTTPESHLKRFCKNFCK